MHMTRISHYPLIFMLLFSCMYSKAQDKKAILEILNQQTVEWNKGDLVNFMKGYWNNDSLMFIGKNGVTYGYENTLNNYRKNYSSPEKMGKLFFDILQVKKLSSDYYFVVGKWFLKRTVGDAGGHYTLIFRKIKGQRTCK